MIIVHHATLQYLAYQLAKLSGAQFSRVTFVDSDGRELAWFNAEYHASQMPNTHASLTLTIDKGTRWWEHVDPDVTRDIIEAWLLNGVVVFFGSKGVGE